MSRDHSLRGRSGDPSTKEPSIHVGAADPSVPSRSHGVWPSVHGRLGSLAASSRLAGALAGLVAIAGISQGCIFIDDDDDDGYYYYTDDDGTVDPPIDEEIFTVGIDEGATLQADPGEGVGLFVEYEGAGDWRVWTTCDSELSGYACGYEIYTTARGSRFIDGEDLEGSDFIEEDLDGAYIYLDTDFDTDGVTFTADEGEPLLLEVYLDGANAKHFVYWIKDGVINRGAPSNPIEFLPPASAEL